MFRILLQKKEKRRKERTLTLSNSQSEGDSWKKRPERDSTLQYFFRSILINFLDVFIHIKEFIFLTLIDNEADHINLYYLFNLFTENIINIPKLFTLGNFDKKILISSWYLKILNIVGYKKRLKKIKMDQREQKRIWKSQCWNWVLWDSLVSSTKISPH